MNQQLLRNIPAVDDLLRRSRSENMTDKYGRPSVKNAINQYLEELRRHIRENGESEPVPDEALEPDHILDAVQKRLNRNRSPSIVRVVNGTGVVLHTGLGRAVLGEDVLDHLRDVHGGYSLLAVNREKKERVRRERRAAEFLCELTGAEAATAVNNNAAAVFLILSAFARDRDVVISRGELVEIGGSFRIPDVMKESGSNLVEVGTTNKTHLHDYRSAIGPDTAMLMKAHTSNYRVVGFQEDVSMKALSELADEYDLLAVEDLGSGALVDVTQHGLDPEPVARNRIKDGADLVCFSGDKLLGGPQAGLIAGRRGLIDTLRNHPLFRALRLDKLMLTALEKTLLLYLQPDRWSKDLPVHRMLSKSREKLRKDAQKLVDVITELDGYTASTRDDISKVGGGSLPGEELPTVLVRISTKDGSAGDLSLRLRSQDPPIFGRVKDNAFHLDPRTLVDGDVERVRDGLQTARDGVS